MNSLVALGPHQELGLPIWSTRSRTSKYEGGDECYDFL